MPALTGEVNAKYWHLNWRVRLSTKENAIIIVIFSRPKPEDFKALHNYSWNLGA